MLHDAQFLRMSHTDADELYATVHNAIHGTFPVPVLRGLASDEFDTARAFEGLNIIR